MITIEGLPELRQRCKQFICRIYDHKPRGPITDGVYRWDGPHIHYDEYPTYQCECCGRNIRWSDKSSKWEYV